MSPACSRAPIPGTRSSCTREASSATTRGPSPATGPPRDSLGAASRSADAAAVERSRVLYQRHFDRARAPRAASRRHGRAPGSTGAISRSPGCATSRSTPAIRARPAAADATGGAATAPAELLLQSRLAAPRLRRRRSRHLGAARRPARGCRPRARRAARTPRRVGWRGRDVRTRAGRDIGKNFPPHPTSAAALLTLLRNTLIEDDGERLRPRWARAPHGGRAARFARAPTRWGTIGLSFGPRRSRRVAVDAGPGVDRADAAAGNVSPPTRRRRSAAARARAPCCARPAPAARG